MREPIIFALFDTCRSDYRRARYASMIDARFVMSALYQRCGARSRERVVTFIITRCVRCARYMSQALYARGAVYARWHVIRSDAHTRAWWRNDERAARMMRARVDGDATDPRHAYRVTR